MEQSGGGDDSRNKIILYWTKYFEWTDFGVGTGRRPFVNAGCNVTNCRTTTDRSLLNRSHAVLFHARDLDPDDLPPAGWRSPKQKFVFFNYESPLNTDLARLKLSFNRYFNWTMTYRRDSDVVSLQPYGRLKCAQPSCQPMAAASSSDPLLPDLKLKNRTAAWFVSNCRTASRRESLVRNLTQHMPVDVFGNCLGGRKCSDRAECNRMLRDRYRFYFSFENSLCSDYVTEKLYRALEYDTVPVVYGGADYSQYLPAGSYVNAMDFASPSHLASYLLQFMDDDDGYREFFRWKERYKVDPEPLDGWCQLCQLLNDPAASSDGGGKSYDVASWWAGNRGPYTNLSCSPPASTLVSPDDGEDSGLIARIHRLLDTLHQMVHSVGNSA